ncbi:MAG: hypothetical protein AcusKO_07170 [Acuticoccus sp.]
MENIRRVAEDVKLSTDAGMVTLVVVHLAVPPAPTAHVRREMVEDGEFVEVFIDNGAGKRGYQAMDANDGK